MLLALLLAALLGHPRFPVREAASAHLAAHVDAALPLLVMLERSPDAEVSYRAGVLVTAWVQEHADEISRTVYPTGWTCHPWISSKPPQHLWPVGVGSWWHDVECQYLDRVPHAVGSFEPDWLRYREATRLLVRDLIARRVPLAVIRAFLDTMAREDMHWWATHRPHGKNP